jgi:hypothetical protein
VPHLLVPAQGMAWEPDDLILLSSETLVALKAPRSLGKIPLPLKIIILKKTLKTSSHGPQIAPTKCY